MEDRRRRQRVEVQFTVEVQVDGLAVPVVTRNLSLKGVLVAGDPRLTAGRPCQVHITLAPDIRVVIQGHIIRSDEQEAAIDFTTMDENSFFHLRQIMEHNAPGWADIAAELSRSAFELGPKVKN